MNKLYEVDNYIPGIVIYGRFFMVRFGLYGMFWL